MKSMEVKVTKNYYKYYELDSYGKSNATYMIRVVTNDGSLRGPFYSRPKEEYWYNWYGTPVAVIGPGDTIELLD